MKLKFKQFDRKINNPKTFYGLPKEVKFCSSCTYSNQKPNSELEYKHSIKKKKPIISFDEKNVCSACKIIGKKKKIDWKEREKLLIDLCNKYRKNNGEYDCLVPGSGGKDSMFASHILKYKYRMNPLTVTCAPHIYTDWGKKNFESWIASGFDNYLLTPNKKVQRLLTRLALENIFHPFQPFMMGQMYIPPKIALKFNIKLIFYGENPTEYGNQSDEDENSKKDLKYFSTEDNKNIYISGLSLKELKKFNLSELDLINYFPPLKSEIIKEKIDVRYLGYFLPWHPQKNFYYVTENCNFMPAPERSAGTYSKYSSIDDKMDDLHYYTTYIKFGIGRATYDSSQEIRNNELLRDEGIKLVRKYDGEYPLRFEKEVFDYLTISKEEFGNVYKKFKNPIFDRSYFKDLSNKFRSPHLWYCDKVSEKFILRHKI